MSECSELMSDDQQNLSRGKNHDLGSHDWSPAEQHGEEDHGHEDEADDWVLSSCFPQLVHPPLQILQIR